MLSLPSEACKWLKNREVNRQIAYSTAAEGSLAALSISDSVSTGWSTLSSEERCDTNEKPSLRDAVTFKKAVISSPMN